jgi:hypothetical protein
MLDVVHCLRFSGSIRAVTISINPLKPKLVYQPITIAKINQLTLFKETVAVYSENLMKPINTIFFTVPLQAMEAHGGRGGIAPIHT